MKRASAFLLLLVIGVIVSLMLGGCASSNFETPINPEYRKISASIHWIETDDVRALCQNQRAIACAMPELDPCVIITYPNPDFHTLGHEFVHCFKGRYHP